jgi:hypothetical protein
MVLTGVLTDEAAAVALSPGLSVGRFGFAVSTEEDVVLGYEDAHFAVLALLARYGKMICAVLDLAA